MRDGLHQDCCLMVKAQTLALLLVLSLKRAGEVCMCDFMCVHAGSMSNDR